MWHTHSTPHQEQPKVKDENRSKWWWYTQTTMAGLKERAECEMHERLYRRPGTAFRSNKAQLLGGFKTAEESQVAKHWLYSQEPYVLGRQAPMVRGNSPGEKLYPVA